MFRSFNNNIFIRRFKYRNIQIRENNTVNMFINGKSVNVPANYTVYQAINMHNITIPTFCFHQRLSIAGNCRMCLVQIEGFPVPKISCAMPVGKGMKVLTNSPVTRKAQEGVLELLLVDHPLDCPICDQGGECDLQDLTMRFGNDRSRFTDIHFEGKRAVENKELSPLIRAVMNRCIHCTRCIRFSAQISGVELLGSTGRGHDMLVGTYVEKEYFSELSGNIIDLCPVGALTSIPYMFQGRPWELRKANSIDVMDATGTNITIDYRFDRVLRVLPRENDEINEEWLSDKGRWAIDSLEMQRLVVPMVRFNNCCVPVEWECALQTACEIIMCAQPSEIVAIAGPHTNVETLVVCKDFLNMIGCDNTYIERGMPHLQSGSDIRAGYSLNMKMCDIAQADKILLIGTNPRFEAPILNAWIRQAYRNNEADIYVIGPKCEYNYHVEYIGASACAIANAKDQLGKAKKPLIFIGVEQLDQPFGGEVWSAATALAASLKKGNWEVLHVIPLEASYSGALEVGWKFGGKAQISCEPRKQVIISLGADQVFYDWEPTSSQGTRGKMIYVGFQGDRGAELADLILPGCAYTECQGVYLNMEARSQFASQAVTPPGKARHDWKIFRALAEYCKQCMFYSDHIGLCARISQISPVFSCLGKFQPRLNSNLLAKMAPGKSNTGLDSCPFNIQMQQMPDYYCSDIFTFNSPTMVKTKKAAKLSRNSPYFLQ